MKLYENKLKCLRYNYNDFYIAVLYECLNLKENNHRIRIPPTCNVKFYKFRIKYLQNDTAKVNEIFSRY